MQTVKALIGLLNSDPCFALHNKLQELMELPLSQEEAFGKK